MTAAVRSSRRVSAGITPAPGATSALGAWWSEDDWLAELSDALAERPELLTDHHVSREAVMATAKGMAEHADYRTGRDCRPTNARLVEVLRCSLSTIQRARRVLKALDMVVELIAGRSIMTRAERLAAWRRGSSHRQIAAVFALCSRSRRAPKRTTSWPEISAVCGERPAHLVDGDTPPGALTESAYLRLGSGPLRRQTETSDEDGAPRRAPTRESPGRPVGDPAARRLAEAVRGRLGWLRGVSARRTAPTLTRFARAGWTARDVDLAVRDALATRGWHRIPAELRQPAAYLAALLRPLDPADRPTVWEDELRAVEAAENAYRLQLATGAPCPHGMPAGHVRSPLRGLLACPSCRSGSGGHLADQEDGPGFH